MSDAAEVIQYGTDSSGRPIYMTRFMADWWRGVIRHLGWEPVVIQGAWMSRAGGGASASEGFHDKGGCLDIRTRDLSDDRKQQLIRVTRLGGAGSWIRYPSQGFDEHCHLVLGADYGKSYLAAQQWGNYQLGDAGLDGPQRDYHWRPEPLVLTPPADYLTEDWFEMASKDDLREVVDAALEAYKAERITVKTANGSERTLTRAQWEREVFQKAARAAQG